jgi:hypothetical protein
MKPIAYRTIVVASETVKARCEAVDQARKCRLDVIDPIEAEMGGCRVMEVKPHAHKLIGPLERLASKRREAFRRWVNCRGDLRWWEEAYAPKVSIDIGGWVAAITIIISNACMAGFVSWLFVVNSPSTAAKIVTVAVMVAIFCTVAGSVAWLTAFRNEKPRPTDAREIITKVMNNDSR